MSVEELQAASETFVAETTSQIQDLLNVRLEDFKRMHRESYSGMIEPLHKLIETKVKKPFAIVMTDEFTENAGGEKAAKAICGDGYAIESPLTMLTAANVELLIRVSTSIGGTFALLLTKRFSKTSLQARTWAALRRIVPANACLRVQIRNGKKHEDHVEEVNKKYSGRIVIDCDDVYSLPTRKSGGKFRRYVPMRCTKHNYSFKKRLGELCVDDGGCMPCRSEKISQNSRADWDDVKRRFIEAHGDKYDYSQVQYVNMATKIPIYCNKCKDTFFQSSDSHIIGKGCKRCSDLERESKGEKVIRDYLAESRFEFEPQYKYLGTEIGDLMLDFRCFTEKGNEVLLEFDGAYHFEVINRNVQRLIDQQRRDKMKDDFSIKNRIPMLRIYYKDASELGRPRNRIHAPRIIQHVRNFIAKVDAEGYVRVYTETYPEKLRRY